MSDFLIEMHPHALPGCRFEAPASHRWGLRWLSCMRIRHEAFFSLHHIGNALVSL